MPIITERICFVFFLKKEYIDDSKNVKQKKSELMLQIISIVFMKEQQI